MQNSERLTYSVREAAQVLGLSRNSAYQAVLRGEIHHVRIGRRILIPRVQLDRMLAEAGRPRES